MFVYELIKLHHLEKQAVGVVVRYKEQERRKVFAKKLACRALLWLSIIFVSLILALTLIEPEKCLETQATEWLSVCQNC